MSAGGSLGSLPLGAILARWDALVIRWALSCDERSLLLGCFADGAIDDVTTYRTADAEARMRLLVELEPIVSRFHGSETRVQAWLRAANRNLAGRSPLEAMARSTEWTRWLIANLGTAS